MHAIIGKARLTSQAENAHTPQIQTISLRSTDPMRAASNFDSFLFLPAVPTHYGKPDRPPKPLPADDQLSGLFCLR